ncbi:MAG: hypothetical protein E7613_07250 [Ruminococcaceae bacterium]|nr:hypothetical protein [Oscillospiraceae bacterium]
MKRFLSLFIVIVMCTSLVAPLTGAKSPFTDVMESDWYYKDVEAAYSLGLINGKGSADTYKPNDNMTYAEAIKLAACMHQSYTEGKVTLTNGDPWYQSYVDYCKEKGIISKEYNYNQLVTRLGYMEIFAKALPDEALTDMNTVPKNSIPDLPSDTAGADSVYKMYRVGIVAGVDAKHNCNPSSNIKRSEVAAILSRMMDKTKRVSFDTIATAPIEEVPMEKFELPEKNQWENFAFNKKDGEKGEKTVAEQRQEILDGMNLAINTETVWKEIPEYNPTVEKYKGIKAITYDGFEYKGKKTKIFAYVGFPEGASAENKVPAVVLVHGGGGHAYYKWVKIWNDRGYAAIAMDTTGYFPSAVNVGETEGNDPIGPWVYGLTEDFAEEGYGNAPKREYDTTYAEVKDQWAYHGTSQVILAHNILRADERVDINNIGITGISWGGVGTAQVIGYDNRFSFAIPIYGTAYLANDMHAFSSFGNDYVDALWAPERNLSNAKDMPILWLAYNDDNNFSVPAYCDSYKHTAGYNDKNLLVMLGNWSHSHSSGWGKEHSYIFADWITYGKNGMVTFVTQPKGREVNCRINIPENVTGSVVAYAYTINAPMSYSKHDKFGWGSYTFLDQKWERKRSYLTVDKTTGTVRGTLPEEVKGYYIDLQYKVNGKVVNSMSTYVAID